jgi:hypothetical protein
MDARVRLLCLANAAVTRDGFITVMGAKQQDVQQDIPAAFEAYTLLLHFLPQQSVVHTTLSDDQPLKAFAPAVYFDADSGRVLALIPVGANELESIAYWCTLNIMSKTVKQMPGLLALPFSLEVHAEMEVLIPDWCAAFFVDGQTSHCVPILLMRSMLTQEVVAQDWVRATLERLRVFGLPTEAAILETQTNIYGVRQHGPL